MERLEGGSVSTLSLVHAGLTNRETEDIGILATARVREYHFYCSSIACAHSKSYVFKFTTNVWINNCPDCRQMLFNRRLPGKKVIAS